MAGSSCAVETSTLRAGVDLEAEHRRCVEIGEEDQDVVLLVVAAQVVDERRAPRPLLLQPLHLVVRGVCGLL